MAQRLVLTLALLVATLAIGGARASADGGGPVPTPPCSPGYGC
jgi:hypothetical protein